MKKITSKHKNDAFKVELKKRLNKAYRKVKKQVESHFKRDGWDLDAWTIEGDVYHEIFGGIGGDTLYKLSKELGKPLEYKNGNFVFSNHDYVPVSYNTRTNKIHIGTFKDTINEEWVYLGTL